MPQGKARRIGRNIPNLDRKYTGAAGLLWRREHPGSLRGFAVLQRHAAIEGYPRSSWKRRFVAFRFRIKIVPLRRGLRHPLKDAEDVGSIPTGSIPGGLQEWRPASIQNGPLTSVKRGHSGQWAAPRTAC